MDTQQAMGISKVFSNGKASKSHVCALAAILVVSLFALALVSASAPSTAFAAERFPQLASEKDRTDAVPLLIAVELDSEAVKAEAMEAIRYWRQDALDNNIVTDADLKEHNTTRDEYLNGFEWSSEVETIAIQRSAETHIFWDHIRPDGKSCFSLTDAQWYDDIAEQWREGPAQISSGGEVVSSINSVTGGINSFASERYAYIRQLAGEDDNSVTGHYTFLVLNFTSKANGNTAVYGFGAAGSLVGEGGTFTTFAEDGSKRWTNKSAGYKGTYDVTVRVKDFTCKDYWGNERVFDVSMQSSIGESRIKVDDTTSISTKAFVTNNGNKLVENWEKPDDGFRVAADCVQYKSSNENVATVDAKGVVTGVGEGTATITVIAGSETSSVTVEVVQPKPAAIEKPQISTLLDTQPALPKTVQVTWNIGDPTQEPVTWDAFDAGKLAAKGSFVVKGNVAIKHYGGFERTTTATCVVEANVARLAGSNALKTMQQIVGFNVNKPREYGNVFKDKRGGTVIVATSEGYWDVLTASALAGLEDACVLMTASAKLSDETKAEVARLAPERIYVCGGSAAVSDAAKKALEAYAPVERLSGSTAVGTAIAIFNKGAKRGTWSDTAIVATASGYWDALSISPYAYSKRAPIFLTDSDGTLSKDTLAAIKKGGFKHVLIVGGTAVVAPSVEKQLGSLFERRLSGSNAIATSQLIAKYELAHGMTNEGMGIATADGYWDALCGAALCGQRGAVLALTLPERYEAIDAAIAGKGADITVAYVFGGEASIDPATYDYLKSKL